MKRAQIVGIGLACVWSGWTAGPVCGQVDVPPVVVSTLSHSHSYDSFQNWTTTIDEVTFPCAAGACSGPGFTATITYSTGIEARFEAPSGKRFQVTNTPGDLYTYLTFDATWSAGGTAGTYGAAEQVTVLFENAQGTVPSVVIQNSCGVSSTGNRVRMALTYRIDADVSFTAFRVSFSTDNDLPAQPRTFGPVSSGEVELRRVVSGNVANQVLMSIGNATLGTLELVPPVTFSTFTHLHYWDDDSFDAVTRDSASCVGVACGSAFSASIGTSDGVRTRIRAPGGQRFVVTRRPTPMGGGGQSIRFAGTWSTGNTSDTDTFWNDDPPVFVGLRGTPPVPDLSQETLNVTQFGNRIRLYVYATVTDSFTFTEMRVDSQVVHQVADAFRTYTPVSASLQVEHWQNGNGPGDPGDAGTLIRVAPPCVADLAYNEGVDVADLLAVINAWGPCANPSNCPADIAPIGPPQGNDLVNVDDLLAVINAWGPCP